MREALHAVVEGTVQGVGFRWFVARQARALGLVGTAANMPDGTVRVVAVGERADLDALVALLREGPPASHVRSVNLQWAPATDTYRDFSAF